MLVEILGSAHIPSGIEHWAGYWLHDVRAESLQRRIYFELSTYLSIYYYLFNIESLKNRGMPLLFRKKNIVQLVCDGLFEIIDRFSITIFDTGGAISPDFSFMLVIFSVKEINYLQEAI